MLGSSALVPSVLRKQPRNLTWLRHGVVEAIRRDGLSLRGENGDIHINPTSATDNPSSIGPVDIVLFCVKLYDVESAAELIKPLIKKDTIVISFLNGIYLPERLAKIIGKEHVIGGAAFHSSFLRYFRLDVNHLLPKMNSQVFLLLFSREYSSRSNRIA